MTVEIINLALQDTLFQKYDREWKINKLVSLKNKCVRIPPFSPMSDIDLTFCIEIFYEMEEESTVEPKHWAFKLTFTKLSGFNLPELLKMSLNIEVLYSDNAPLMKYISSFFIDVADMLPVVLSFNTRELGSTSRTSLAYSKKFTYHSVQISMDYLVVKCNAIFTGHLPKYSRYSHQINSFMNRKSFAKDFNKLLRNKYFSDIVIKIDDKSINAHKSVLAAHSEVFLRMLQKPETNTISIQDSKYEICENFFKFLYSGKLEDKSWNNVKNLYLMADIYEVKSLKQECEEILMAFHLSTENACEILKIAYDCNDFSLKKRAKVFAANNFCSLILLNEWKELVAHNPMIGYEVSMLHSFPEKSNSVQIKVFQQKPALGLFLWGVLLLCAIAWYLDGFHTVLCIFLLLYSFLYIIYNYFLFLFNTNDN